MAKYCANCGQVFGSPKGDSRLCGSCGAFAAEGPSLLVMAGVFAEEKLLLVRRGIEPYVGMWAPPGGFVEKNESVETAAAREVAEETGLSVAPEQFLITGLISLTRLNQVHILMNAVIDRAPDLTPQLPETTEIKWFSKQDFPKDDIWTPYHYRRLTPEMLFWPVENGGYRFFQETDSRRRAILTEASLHHPWHAIE
jgi:ADP-ribose pyrophosphatase YjhB (NUDIX family)